MGFFGGKHNLRHPELLGSNRHPGPRSPASVKKHQGFQLGPRCGDSQLREIAEDPLVAIGLEGGERAGPDMQPQKTRRPSFYCTVSTTYRVRESRERREGTTLTP